MKQELGVFIFTKDRPGELQKNLNTWAPIPYSFYIVDDSVNKTHQKCNREIASLLGGNYLGHSEFRNFVTDQRIDLVSFSFLLRELGSESWNLGYARNFALLFARAQSFRKVLFLDDDITIASPVLIESLFSGLNNNKFTGAHICGLPDDSILGHIATDLHISNERTLSGGCLAFKPTTIEHYFLNNYNEDWIWLYLQNSPKTAFQIGEVFQTWVDPLYNYEAKILFQEFGELLYEGVLCCYDTEPAKTLCNIEFWNRITQERKEYIEQLYKAAAENGRIDVKAIISFLLESIDFGATDCAELFSEYFHNLDAFKPLFESLDP